MWLEKRDSRREVNQLRCLYNQRASYAASVIVTATQCSVLFVKVDTVLHCATQAAVTGFNYRGKRTPMMTIIVILIQEPYL